MKLLKNDNRRRDGNEGKTLDRRLCGGGRTLRGLTLLLNGSAAADAGLMAFPVCADRCGTAGAVADGRSTERTGDHALCGSLTASGGLPLQSVANGSRFARTDFASYERYALRYALGGGQPGMAGAAVVCRENAWTADARRASLCRSDRICDPPAASHSRCSQCESAEALCAMGAGCNCNGARLRCVWKQPSGAAGVTDAAS